ncbi:MAG TPA: hypothetical protein DD401_01725 [Prevotella sp.]|nr:hypothetical protein [Prevotella sp.]
MRKLTLLTLLFLVGLCSHAKDITPSQATSIAQRFLGQQAGSGTKRAAAKLQLAYTGRNTTGQNCLYVFNAPSAQGYVIVAADDQADEILGYSDSGTFSMTDMPDNLRSWIGTYIDQISYLKRTHLTKSKAPASAPYEKEVKPLLGNIQWNQDSPYNDQCPAYDISSRCATGCVATAMAQVMYYNRWPEQGVGTHTYAPSILNGKTLTADFANTHYAWDAMLPQYDANSSDESREAVAQLMLHCGVSVDMQYSSSSGAASLPIPQALVNYFGYDRGIAFRTRQNYSSTEWQSIIIDELDHQRPLIAMGRSSAGGHCFVFDGYDRNGLIHVNWGWGGMSNGYFRTSALTPATQGIGGADGGFNYNQYIVTGIQRPVEGTHSDIELVSSEGLVPSKSHVDKDTPLNVTLHGTLYNAGWQDAPLYFGLVAVDAAGQQTVIQSLNAPDTVQMGYMYNGLTFDNVSLSSLADGSYRLYPAARSTEEGSPWHPIRDEYVGYPNYLNVTMANGAATLTYPDYFCLNADSVSIEPEVFAKKLTQVKAHIANTGDVNYLGEVQPLLLDAKTGRKVAEGTKQKIDLAPGADIDIDFVGAFNVEPGDYLLTLIDDDERHICNSRKVSIQAAPDEAVVTPAEQLAFKGTVNKENLDITAHIKCTSGFYSGYAYLFILNESGAVQKGCLDPQYFSVKEGDIADVRFTGPFENGVDGTVYTATILLYDGTNYAILAPREMSTCQFTLGTETGVDAIVPGSNTLSEAAIYNINGTRIQATDLHALPHGTYIVKANGKTFKFSK